MTKAIISLFLLGVCLLAQNVETTLVSVPPPSPSSVTATVSGTTGGRQLFYWVVAVFPRGTSVAAGPASVFNGPDTLSASDFVRISWGAVTGVTFYTVLRSTTTDLGLVNGACSTCAVATGLTVTSTTDTGGALSAFSATSIPSVTGILRLNNRDFPVPRVEFQFPNGVFYQISSVQNAWEVNGVGPLASRPATCRANRDVYICNGTGCTANGEYHYCTSTDTYTITGGSGTVSPGTDNQVPTYSGAGATLADADCTFTIDGTNIIVECPTDATEGFRINDTDGNVAFNVDTSSNPPRVGIGTATPATALETIGSIRATDSGSGRWIAFEPDALGSFGQIQTTNDSFRLLSTLGVLRVITTAGGAGSLVDVNTITPIGSLLTVSGAAMTADPGGTVPACELYTVLATDLTAAATTEDEVLFNLPARGKLTGVNIKHTIAFSGGTLSAMTVSVGDSSSTTLYTSAFDIFQAVSDTTFLDADMFLSSTFAARDVLARFISTGDTMDNITVGSVGINVCWVVLP